MTEKICRDCRWMRKPGEFARCVAPQNMVSTEPLTGFGRVKPGLKYCSAHRSSPAGGSHDCGSEGRYFEPKGARSRFWWLRALLEAR